MMWLIKRITRHYKKNLLLILTVVMMSVLFFISTAIRENSEAQIESFLSSYKVTAYYIKKNAYFSNRGGMWLSPKAAGIPIKHEKYIQSYSITRSMFLTVSSAESNAISAATVLALTDLTMLNRPELENVTLSGYTNEDFKLNKQHAISVISRGLADELSIAVGGSIEITDVRGTSSVFEVCGIFDGEANEAIIPITHSKNIYVINPKAVSERVAILTNFYDTNLYVLKDMNEVEQFKQAMSQENEFRGARFVIDDRALNETVLPLRTTINYMDSAIIILLIISILIAFTVSFILLKSRSAEIAIMYCIGLSKTKIFFSLFFELAATIIVAIICGIAVGMVISVNYIGAANIPETIARLGLLFAALSIGAAVSIISSIAVKPMDILTKKEG